MISVIKSTYRRLRRKLPFMSELDRLHVLNSDRYARELLREERYASRKKLNHFEMQTFSQSGEDGIIHEILRRVGAQTRTFVEIGVGDGLENNTVFLLFQNWSGFWIEGSQKLVQQIDRTFREPITQGRLKVLHSLVTAENVADSLRELEVPTELDILSLDIDRNTYWIWAALSSLQPRVVVVEYNGAIPADVDWKVEYDPHRVWNGTDYFGASLKAYETLGRKLGYALVGCTLNGVNAFFVRQDLCGDKFEEPFTSEHHFEPHRRFLTGRSSHPRCFSDTR